MPRKKAAEEPKKKVVRAKAKTVRKPATRRTKAKPAVEAPAFSASIESISHGHSIHSHDEQHEVKIKQPDNHTRRLVMWISVSTIMTLILVAWIMNLTSLLGPDVEASPAPTQSQIDFEKFKSELNDTLSDVKDNLRDMKQISSELVTDTAAPAADADNSAFEKFRDQVEQQAGPTTGTSLPATLPE